MEWRASEAAVQWFQYYRDVCTEWLLHNPIQLGGEGRIVEINESVIARRKYHRGHHVPERWIFGMFDRTQKIGMDEFLWRQFHGESKAHAFDNLLLHLSGTKSSSLTLNSMSHKNCCLLLCFHTTFIAMTVIMTLYIRNKLLLHL